MAVALYGPLCGRPDRGPAYPGSSVDAVRHAVSANDSSDAMKIRPLGNRLGLGARRQAFPRLGVALEREARSGWSGRPPRSPGESPRW
jgi:hypothetical protein